MKVVECLYLDAVYFELAQKPHNGFCFFKFSIITLLCVFVPQGDFFFLCQFVYFVVVVIAACAY